MSAPSLPSTQRSFPAFLVNAPLSLSTDEANKVWMGELSAEDRCVDLVKAELRGL